MIIIIDYVCLLTEQERIGFKNKQSHYQSCNNCKKTHLSAVSVIISVCFLVDEFILFSVVIIRLEAKLQPNIRFTLRRVLMVFTRSAITPP